MRNYLNFDSLMTLKTENFDLNDQKNQIYDRKNENFDLKNQNYDKKKTLFIN